MSQVPARLWLPGLDPDRRYRVAHVPLPGESPGLATHQPAWMGAPVVLTGRQLAAVGVQPPAMPPESAVLVHLAAPDLPSTG